MNRSRVITDVMIVYPWGASLMPRWYFHMVHSGFYEKCLDCKVQSSHHGLWPSHGYTQRGAISAVCSCKIKTTIYRAAIFTAGSHKMRHKYTVDRLLAIMAVT